MDFTLSLKLNNAAMRSDDGNGDNGDGYAVAEILRSVASSIDGADLMPGAAPKTLRDANGNDVGNWTVTGD